MKPVWDEDAWGDSLYWQTQDRNALKRINALLRDTQRNKNEGKCKPEALKCGLHRVWSLRITDVHRLVYKVTRTEILIAQCRYHHH